MKFLPTSDTFCLITSQSQSWSECGWKIWCFLCIWFSVIFALYHYAVIVTDGSSKCPCIFECQWPVWCWVQNCCVMSEWQYIHIKKVSIFLIIVHSTYQKVMHVKLSTILFLVEVWYRYLNCGTGFTGFKLSAVQRLLIIKEVINIQVLVSSCSSIHIIRLNIKKQRYPSRNKPRRWYIYYSDKMYDYWPKAENSIFVAMYIYNT